MKSIILLAFANDRQGQFLRNIASENQTINLALESAKKEGICEVITLADATIETIIQQFHQNPNIKIFHYGGHASETKLKLNTQIIQADSLAEFLISQQNLELVFLNGCSTQTHAKALNQGGIPSVITTDQAINDNVAREFAKAFYQNLATGDTISFAYQQAAASIKLQKQGDFRSCFLDGIDEVDDFPWQIQSHKENTWKLPSLPKGLTPYPTVDLEDIIGREKELIELHQILNVSQKVLLVNGLGGVGKTTLAQAYLTKHLSNFNHIVWITVQPGNTFNIINAFANNIGLFENLAIPFNPEEENEIQRCEKILRALRKISGNNLLIIDNASKNIQKIHKLLPARPWEVIITSRQIINPFKKYTLDVLNPKEARRLFLKHYPNGNEESGALDDLLEYIGYHTLTLEIFAKICHKKSTISIGDCLEALKKKKLDQQELQTTVWTDHSDSEIWIYTHLLAAFDLVGLTPIEISLLQYFTLLPIQNITIYTLFDLFQTPQNQQNQQEENLFRLAEKGWLIHSHVQNTYLCHQIIKEIVYYRSPPDKEICQKIIDGACRLLNFDETKDNPIDFFPNIHIGKTVLLSVPEIDLSLRDLLYQLGSLYYESGQYKSGIEVLFSALGEDIKTHGEKHPNIAKDKDKLGLIYYNLAEYDKAVEYLKSALELCLELYSPMHPNIAEARNNLAMVYEDLGQLQKAKELYNLALESGLRNYGPNHLIVSKYRNNLGILFSNLELNHRAKELLELSLNIDIKTLGLDHPYISTRRTNLGDIYRKLGQYTQAIEQIQLALKADLKSYGEEHPLVISRRYNLGKVYLDTDQLGEAIRLFHLALTACLKIFSSEPNHPHIAITRSKLGEAYLKSGQYKKAIELFKLALESDLKTFLSNHIRVAANRFDLGKCYFYLNETQKAKELCKQAYYVYLEKFGENDSRCRKIKAFLDKMQ